VTEAFAEFFRVDSTLVPEDIDVTLIKFTRGGVPSELSTGSLSLACAIDVPGGEVVFNDISELAAAVGVAIEEAGTSPGTVKSNAIDTSTGGDGTSGFIDLNIDGSWGYRAQALL